MTDDILTLESLTAGYLADVPVLEGVDLAIAPGQAIGIIGRNGAGKSCLAMTIAGALAPQHGAIRLAGEDISATSARARVRSGIALVPEGRQVFAQLSVRENLVAAAYGVGRRLTGSAFGQVTEFFPILKKKESHLAASLSGGEQQMLAIARALVQSPQVIVCDEPSLGLAPVAIDSLAQTLATIRDSGVAFILMEQNRGLLEDLCSSVNLLDAGRIKMTVSPEELSRPEVMAAYLGHAPTADAL
ncbi:ABC transporter ATP-binding protein [Nocardioides hwasunensis]|uniref:ATP-binding cassette domain-containing protein n=1 Tax=Nocardioides hwasunensis TaxID=397258 RepID=A0ABR8MG58_9ACTN|nr:ATP-binding cassette domain-containing protein [Nocardioides hwasunensis]MBD3915065.1 ATP-binding cassette domain-containing protein [Nocardioides hwasunensis]